MAGEDSGVYELQPPANGGMDDPQGLPSDVPTEGEEPVGFFVKPPSRKKTLVKDKEKTVAALIKKYGDDLMDRADWTERRIQRTAKYRGWRENKVFPWENASNAHLPIIMTDVQRTEDTLHNAVLSVRPVMNAKAASKAFEPKEKKVDQLLDHQVFVENQGEVRIGNLISSFCQDGQFISYNPYIKEKQKVTRVHMLDFPPSQISWDKWILQSLQQYYPKAIILPGKKAPWNWEVKTVHPLTGETVVDLVEVVQDGQEPRVQLLCHKDETIFDGPSFIPKELEDIVVPGRCENLQPQTMANPTGAPHVFMVDYPSKDEILKLIENKFYDEVSKDDLEKIKSTKKRKSDSNDPEAQKRLQDDLTGIVTESVANEQEDSYVRLTYFGREDIDGDGFEEEVVYWFLENPQVLLRARYLTEVYPTTPLRRPFAMAKYIPVNGQFYAIGLIEMMESGYDIIKKTFDQMIDSGELTNTPWGFYRPMSGIRPEVIRMAPGDLYPTNSPKDDVHYPTLPQGMAAFGQNTIALVSQILDQATLVGQLQLGGVPAGKSSALRTTSNMQSLLQQGDARPERVMRRFFGGLVEIWHQFHELNQIFLPRSKQFRITSGVTKETDPFVTVENREAIQGRFMFEFGASILNTNRALATSAYQNMFGVLINPLLLQLGIVTPTNMFTLCSDWVKSLGQDPLKYVTTPSNDPFAMGPKISVEDAITSILNGYFPYGNPMEPFEEHLQKLQEFVTDKKNLDVLTPQQVGMLSQYAAIKVSEYQQIMQQQQMMQNAAMMQKSVGGPGQEAGQAAANPPNTGPGGNAKVQGGEMLDESLPGAGGGSNP